MQTFLLFTLSISSYRNKVRVLRSMCFFLRSFSCPLRSTLSANVNALSPGIVALSSTEHEVVVGVFSAFLSLCFPLAFEEAVSSVLAALVRTGGQAGEVVVVECAFGVVTNTQGGDSRRDSKQQEKLQ